MPRSWAATSNRVKSPLRNVTTSCGGISDVSAVKPTKSANATVTSANPSAILASPPRSRFAIGRQNVEQQLLVLAILVLNDFVFLAEILDHPVEREAELANLVARADGHLGGVVACSETPYSGGKLAQWPK